MAKRTYAPFRRSWYFIDESSGSTGLKSGE
jgi:hypothetical protein